MGYIFLFGDKVSSKCKMCNMHKRLIKAHVYPKYFYSRHSIIVASEDVFNKRSPNGVYDTSILCAECDNYLGGFDSYAKDVLIDGIGVYSEALYGNSPFERVLIYRLMEKSGYDKLIKFFISILWRASVSSHDVFQSMDLGSYEDLAKMTLRNNNFKFNRYFSVFIRRITLNVNINLFPAKMKINHVNFYSFIIGRFKVYVRCDKRSLPSNLKSIFTSKSNDFLMIDCDIREQPEHKMLLDMAGKLSR